MLLALALPIDADAVEGKSRIAGKCAEASSRDCDRVAGQEIVNYE